VVTGPQPGTPPLAFVAKVVRMDKNDAAVTAIARTEDGTTITLL
jgi:hypothetical protein